MLTHMLHVIFTSHHLLRLSQRNHEYQTMKRIMNIINHQKCWVAHSALLGVALATALATALVLGAALALLGVLDGLDLVI